MHIRARHSSDMKSAPPWRKHFFECFATGTYLGKLPFMPGTFGTLWGVALAWWFLPLGLGPYITITIVLSFLAIWIADRHEKLSGQHDPGEIVIDEVVGYLVTMIGIPLSGPALLAGFLSFRFFDILKPFPIRWLDRKIPGGFGTVLDDLVAGLFACIVLQVIHLKLNWI